MIEKVKTQKGVIIEHQMVEGANHFFDGKVDELTQTVDTYLDKRLGGRPRRREAGIHGGFSFDGRREVRPLLDAKSTQVPDRSGKPGQRLERHDGREQLSEILAW